jgi:hypothetical protein
MKERTVNVLLSDKCNHVNMIKCMFQIEIVEFVARGFEFDKEFYRLKSAFEKCKLT